MSKQYSLLWVDMKVSSHDDDGIDPFNEHFEVYRHQGAESTDSTIAKLRPRVICFDFDFPTKPALEELRRTKKANSRIPVLMLTVQHSESLAIWAFRTRVWDYFVKPIARNELNYCLSGLLEVLEMQNLQPKARRSANVISLIPDENRINGTRGHAPLTLAPAVQYVETSFRERISSAEAAEKCRLTSFQFSRLFKETYQMTFQDFFLRFRIREACRLLQNPTAEVSEVGYMVGFNDPSYFGKVFKRYMHCSPSQFSSAKESVMSPDHLLEDIAKEAARRDP